MANMLKTAERYYGKDVIRRIISSHFEFEEDVEAIETFYQKVDKLNEIKNIDVMLETDLRIFDPSIKAIDQIWLCYRGAVMIMDAHMGGPDGLNLDENKFEDPKKLIFDLVQYWVSGVNPKIEGFDFDQFIKRTVTNISWIISLQNLE